jgi:hypothetical protein
VPRNQALAGQVLMSDARGNRNYIGGSSGSGARAEIALMRETTDSPRVRCIVMARLAAVWTAAT